MGVAGVTGYKRTWNDVVGASSWTVVKSLGEALSDRINRPPRHFFYIQRKGVENLLRFCNQVLFCQFEVCCAAVFVNHIQFDIEPAQVSTFARDCHHGSVVFGLDKAFDTNIWEICVEKDVHHPPSFIGGIAFERYVQTFAYAASASIAADGEARFYRFRFGVASVVDPFECGCYGVSIQILCETFVNLHVDQFTAVMGAKAGD